MTQRSLVRMATVVVMLVTISLTFCHGTVFAKASKQPIKVLFIGNSYTNYNDMALTVAELGRDLGYDIQPTVRTVGGTSFVHGYAAVALFFLNA